MSILYANAGDGTAWQNIGAAFNHISGYAFLAFNLLCAPCFAAMGAIKREMNNGKWTAIAIGYQCFFAYIVAFCVNQIGIACCGKPNYLGLIIAIAIVAIALYLLLRPYKEAQKLNVKI